MATTMRKAILVAVVGLLIIGILQADFLRAAREHYSLYKSVQRGGRHAYKIAVEPTAYFTPFIVLDGWHNATPPAERTSALGKAFDELKWEKNLRSVVVFYASDTSGIGLIEWMLRPSSAILPSLQELMFLKRDGGVIHVDGNQTVVVEVMNKSMVTLITQTPSGVDESLLIDDSLFSKIKAKQTTAYKK